MIPQTIVVDGYDGTVPEDTSTEPVLERVRRDMDELFPDGWADRWEAGDEAVRAKTRELFQHHLFLAQAVRTHNTAVPAAQQYTTASKLAPRAVAAAHSAYADLDKSTTINWLAAHHRFILATTEARRLLADVVTAAAALHAGAFGKEMRDLTRLSYEQAVPAGQRIVLPDADAAELALAEFVALSQERIDLLRATVSGGYPAGFAPATAPRTAPAPGRTRSRARRVRQVRRVPQPSWPASWAVAAGERDW